jgi:hypothetical protein
MLHELLLSLSGHPSPLLQHPTDKPASGLLHEYLSPAENVLLQRLAQDLGEKHKNVRDTAARISSTHPSTVCRAIATAITLTHLERFQQAILDVEKDILDENPSFVGAYNIVPLSGVVGAFDGWSRKLQWLLSLVKYIQEGGTLGKGDKEHSSCTAAHVIDWLRDSANTGYPDIEQLSYQLIEVAERAWLRLLSAWVLYGKLPSLGTTDFFVHRSVRGGEQEGVNEEYEVKQHLIPSFVLLSTASSVLFIGRSINNIRNRASAMDQGLWNRQSPELALLPSHLENLSFLKPPISASSFSTAISSVRLSLSQNVLQRLLPISKVIEILRILRDFFLLERGEFAIALITAADQRLASRQSRFADKLGTKNAGGLKSAIIKEGEVSAVLVLTWAAMVSLQSADDEDIDEDLELARDLVGLSLKSLGPMPNENGNGIMPTFDDLLLPSPTTLTLHIPSPLDLFLTSSEVQTYSHIHAYLLTLRRAHHRLAQTFLLSVLRRDHPSPKAPSHLPSQVQLKIIERLRHRANHRVKLLRPVWATISSAAFLLAELAAYLEGEVIKSSWIAFHTWLDPNSSSTTSSSRPGTSSSATSFAPLNSNASLPLQRSVQTQNTKILNHDPETITRAHRAYLSSLTHALLLTTPEFTTRLRSLMDAVDHLSALMQRLETVYRNLDLEADMGVVDTFTNYKAEERDVLREVDGARWNVEKGMKGVVRALREIDADRTGGGSRAIDVGGLDPENDVFIPERAGGLDRLLMKLDWGEMSMEL